MTTAVEPPMSEPPKKRISGAWYALVAIPGLVAIFVLATHVPRLIHGIMDLAGRTFTTEIDEGSTHVSLRSDMHVVTLREGENTIYVEGTKVGNTVDAETTLTCGVVDASDRSLTLSPSTSTTMTLGSREYVSQYSVEIPAAGEYRVACSSPVAARFLIGRSFPFLSIVWSLLALFLALPLTGIVGYTVHRIRNGKRKGARIT